MKHKFNFRLLFGLFMLIVYFGMAYLLIFTELFDFYLALRIGFGVVFALYGIFRAYRIWKYGK